MRALLAAVLAACTLLLIAIEGLSVSVTGTVPNFGFRAVDATRRVVTSVSPDAARAGLRAGDEYDWRLSTPEQRRARASQRVGETFILPVARGGKPTPITLAVRPRPLEDRLISYADLLVKILGMGVGILLVARGRGAFGLYSGLALVGFFGFEGFQTSVSILPWPLDYLGFTAIGIVCGAFLRYFIVEAMIALCGDALRPWERVFFRAITALGAVGLAANLLDSVLANAGLLPSHLGGRITFLAQIPLRADMLGYVIALLRPGARDRSLIAWVFWSTVVGLAGATVNLVLIDVGQALPWYGALNLTYFAMAFGSAYVALRYRVVDLSFVVNRAVVYGAILTVVVGGLIFTEMLVTRLALGTGRSFALEISVALVLGFSIKYLERRIDSIVERLLFAKKYAEEEGLRALIRDCAHVENAERLAANVCEETRRLTGAQHVVVYERNGESLTPIAASPENPSMMPVNIDDPVVVRMRSALAPVELGTLRSTLGSGGTLFPMLARGRVVGAIACGSKSGRQAYDPDERRLLSDLAHEAGTSLLLLRTGTTALPLSGDALFG